MNCFSPTTMRNAFNFQLRCAVLRSCDCIFPVLIQKIILSQILCYTGFLRGGGRCCFEVRANEPNFDDKFAKKHFTSASVLARCRTSFCLLTLMSRERKYLKLFQIISCEVLYLIHCLYAVINFCVHPEDP